MKLRLALTQTPPLSYVLAAFNGVLAAANIAKIASAKFDEGRMVVSMVMLVRPSTSE